MIDEGGRIAINKVPAEVLTRVVTNLAQAHIAGSGRLDTGFDRRSAAQVDTVVDSILDWRDHDNLTRAHGAESEFYLKRRVPYHAKNAPFDSPEEMLLVRGVTPELFYGAEGVPGLRDVFSVYSPAGPVRLNLATATPAVLQALLGIEPAAAEDLVAQRKSGAPIIDQVKAQLVAAGQPTLANLVVDAQLPQIVRIQARADMTGERNRSRVEAVAEIGGESGEGTRILRWLDRAPWDGPPPGPPSAGGPEDA
jgi:general secretion pathway protein K